MSKTLYVIDGHSQIFRAYYAPFRDLTSPTGEPTRATYVFVTMLLKLIRQTGCEYLVMAMDSPREQLARTELYPDYKASREAPPEDFAVQRERIVQIVEALGVPIWRGGGVEADDYLASVAAQWAGDDVDVVFVSRDKDLYQCLTEHVAIFDPMNDERITAAELPERLGYPPEKAVDIQTLTGDSTDDIPGVKGIGPKTAVKLIEKYGSAEAVLEHADELTPKQRENVLAFAGQMSVTRQLVTLSTDVDLPGTLDDCRLEISPAEAEAVESLFAELGFTRLAGQVRDLAGVAPGEANPAAGSSADEAGPSEAGQFDYQLIDTPEALEKLVDALAGVGELAVDTETTDTRPVWAHLVGVSLSWERGRGYYIPVRGPMGCKTIDLELLRRKLGPILADEAVMKIGHNLKYDAIVLQRAGMPIAPASIGFDTYLAAYILDPAASGKMDNLAMQHLNHRCIPITDLLGSGAKARTMDEVPTDLVATYAAEDAEVTLRLAEVLRGKLDEQNLAELLGEVEMPLLTVLAEMELAGIAVDPQRLKKQETELSKQAEALHEQIIALAGRPFNPDSPKQLGEVLFTDLGLRVIKKTKTGPSTDAGVLETLAAEHELPALVLEYRQLAKLLGTYLRALASCIHPQTRRVHASFNQGGTITGRLSSSEPNLQNIPIRTDIGRQIRSAFVAGEGKLLLSADYSQIELRVLAHFCEDPTLIAAFEADQDIHRTVAAEVFGVPAEEVTSEQRARAKTVNFGIIYGQTAFGLARTLRIGQGEAQEFIDRYKKRFPQIDAFLGECVQFAKDHGYVETIRGRRRPIVELDSRNPARRNQAERMAINSVVQGSAADLIKLAMVKIHRRVHDEDRPIRMLLQIHDELVFELPAEALDRERAMVIDEMIGAMDLRVPLKVDTGAGPDWMAAK